MKKTKEGATILIVEDDKDYILLITLLLEQLGFRHILSAQNYHEALSIFEEQPVHLLLLDIDLGKGKNGIMLAEEIRRQDAEVPIIYLTSNHDIEHYHYARTTHPSSFMDKELSKLKLYQAIDIALMPFYDPAPEMLPHNTSNILNFIHHNLYFKVGDVFKTIPLDDIVYFYADRKMSYAKAKDRSYPTRVQLKILQEELLSQGFLRIHKSYLVNSKYIESIHPSDSTISTRSETLPIGSTYRKDIFTTLKLLK